MTNEEPLKIRMIHVRQAKMCSSGAREFCLRHNLDWSDFLENGIDEKTLVETGDEMAMQVIRIAKNGR